MTLTSGKLIATLPVGSHPDGLALSRSENYLLVLDSQSGDVTVIQKRKADAGSSQRSIPCSP